VRGIVSIEPQTAPAAGPTRQRQAPVDSVPAFETTDETQLRSRPSPSPAPQPVDDPATVRRPRVVDAAPRDAATLPPGAAAPVEASGPLLDASAPRQRSRRGLWIGLAVAAAAVVVAGVAVAASVLTPEPSPTPTSASSAEPQDPIADIVAAPTDLVGTAAGVEASFTWTNPAPEAGDTFVWYPYTLDGDGAAAVAAEPAVTLPADPSGRTCIAVQVRREDGTSSDVTKGCTP